MIRTPLRRFFHNDQKDIIDPVDPSKSVGFTKLLVPSDSEKKRKAREATIELFVQQARTQKPRRLVKRKDNNDADSVMLYIVVAKEVVTTENKIQEPIEWILLTDIKTDTLEQAKRIVSIYKSRWNIEQIFRLTKQKGFQLENSQLETGHALENLIALVFIAAVKIFQMVKSRNDEHRPALDIFEDDEITVLTKLNKSLEGKSDKSKNKNKPLSLAYVIWVVARLGNWKPQDRDPPGPITMLEGWKTLRSYLKLKRLMSG